MMNLTKLKANYILNSKRIVLGFMLAMAFTASVQATECSPLTGQIEGTSYYRRVGKGTLILSCDVGTTTPTQMCGLGCSPASFTYKFEADEKGAPCWKEWTCYPDGPDT